MERMFTSSVWLLVRGSQSHGYAENSETAKMDCAAASRSRFEASAYAITALELEVRWEAAVECGSALWNV